MYERKVRTPVLFAGWLDKTREMQEKYFLKLYGFDSTRFSRLRRPEKIRYIKEQFIALVAESVEMLDEVSWKPWASAGFLNRDKVLGEAVDLAHFLANILVAIDCTDEEFENAYLEKMAINITRQEQNYTGRHKCAICRRAFEDSTPAEKEQWVTINSTPGHEQYLCSEHSENEEDIA